MDVRVLSVHFTADQKLEEFCERKVSKLDQIFDHIIGAEVALKLEKSETLENKVAEVKLSVPSNDYLFAKKQAKSFEEATDLACEALKKQLGRYKDKLKG